MRRFFVFTFALVAALRATAAEKVTYQDDILPVLRNSCLNCHNPDKKKAGLDLSTYQSALSGSENGKVLESGNPGGSLLLKCVRQTEDPKMPPKGDKLSDAEIGLIEKWIAGQLLETATGQAVVKASNNVQSAVVSLERPAGPPPMPGELPLEPVVRTARSNALVALAASPWAPLVAVGGQKQIVLYHTETLEPLGILPFPEGFPEIIRFSRNGQLLLTGGGLGGKSGQVALWDIHTGGRVATVGNEFDQVLAADLSADQQFVALGGPNRLVKIYATKDGKLLTTIKKHTDWVTAITYSPDGKYLASADRSGGLQVWEGATGKEFTALPGHKAMITALAFLPGVLASASEDGKIVLWDIKEAKEIRNWKAHDGGVAWIDFAPDGRLVSCGRDKLARVWEQSGKKLGESRPFGDIALRAALAGDRVIAGDWTGAIRVSTLDGKPLGELTSNPPPLAERVTQAFQKAAAAQTAQAAAEQRRNDAAQKLDAAKTAFATSQPVLQLAAALPAQLTEQLNAQKAQLAAAGQPAPDPEDPASTATAADAEKLTSLIAKTEAALAEAQQAQAAQTNATHALEAQIKPATDALAQAEQTLATAHENTSAALALVARWKHAQNFQDEFVARTTTAAAP